MKCKPGNCFKCIRENTLYEFAWECSAEILRKMDEEERWELSREVFEKTLEEYETKWPKIPQRDIETLGDCMSCIYMFGLGIRMREGKGPRPRYITMKQVKQVLPIIVSAGKKSMQANGVRSLMRCRNYKFPECWLCMNREYDGPRNRS